jgi:ABC-2 type transport system permease protein
MVEQLLRLKLRLMGNAFKRSPWQLVGLILALVYGIGIAIVVISSLLGLRFVGVPVAASAVTVFGGLLVLGFIVVPIVFGVDDTMDPRKFSLFGLPTSELATALAITALVGVPSLVVALIALAQIVTWSRGPLPVLLAILGAPVILATCILCSRVCTSIAAFLLSSRRSRDLTGMLGIVLLILVLPVFVLLLNANWQRDGLSILGGIATVIGWTPLGAVWSAPSDAAAGLVGQALLKELIALVFVVLLWVAWRYLVKMMLVTQERAATARNYRGLGFFSLGVTRPSAVIADRGFTYWVRDSRYHVSLLAIPVIPFILMIPLLVIGVPPHVLALLPVPVMALFLGWSIHNDLAYDSTAIWLHVASGTRGFADRFGRVIPPLVVGVPLLVIASLICAPLYGKESYLPVFIGVGFGILLTGLGLSSVMSARFPYPAVRPGDSPFAAPQAVGSASAVIQGFSFVVTFILASPTIYLAYLTIFKSAPFGGITLASGVVLGGLLLWAGISWGGYIFDRRSPEILAFSVRN